MSYLIEYPRPFKSHLKEVIKKFPRCEKRIASQIEILSENPDTGDSYPGFGEISVRKIRIPLPEYSIGQSKGLRLIFIILPSKNKIVPLVIYQKGKYAAEHDIKRLVINYLKEVME